MLLSAIGMTHRPPGFAPQAWPPTIKSPDYVSPSTDKWPGQPIKYPDAYVALWEILYGMGKD